MYAIYDIIAEAYTEIMNVKQPAGQRPSNTWKHFGQDAYAEGLSTKINVSKEHPLKG